ncbi:hypothetical protein APASM_5980 [Actinosynnema pretiosum subsp. pretiosum]|nr:hypothetical protein APASM_5980 [Actinosynnema pretiosum subsp. pretiosum]
MGGGSGTERGHSSSWVPGVVWFRVGREVRRRGSPVRSWAPGPCGER